MAFINDKTPEFFNRIPIYVCMMAELSDGQLLHFVRVRYVNLVLCATHVHVADVPKREETQQRARSYVRGKFDQCESNCESIRFV
jgi:hypothetical protein